MDHDNTKTNAQSSLTRRDFVRKSAIATGAISVAGLINAHGEEGGGGGTTTTTTTTTGTTTVVSTCGELVNVTVVVGKGSCNTPPHQVPAGTEYYEIMELRCSKGHKHGYSYRRIVTPTPPLSNYPFDNSPPSSSPPSPPYPDSKCTHAADPEP
jgi:hypothetical protein